MSSKPVQQLLREVEKGGGRWKFTGSDHIAVYGANGAGPVFMANTPSDPRGVKNARAMLRRKGILQ